MSACITLAHGAGGKKTAELIDTVFKAHLANPLFTGDDAAVLPTPGKKIGIFYGRFYCVAVRFSRRQYRQVEYLRHGQ